ncbi:hypothetical protein OsJ_27127 [Oryza sativa Japonica Group]|uniref:Wall-associated receptor kinase galacturonan-binding domain-containing protein n=1 Tax=Oryza sativa subsp. japonica TaxID=39947 RepID=B9G0N0_ORYSJ|nr:hypothetical protein OsJ_27127 [Oryza sativa Japonica Group]
MERVATLVSCIAAATAMLLAVAAAAAGSGGGGCTRSCGNISVPYPFGVEADCYYPGFNLTCNHSYHPPTLFLVDGAGTSHQVLDISISNSTVRINSSLIAFTSLPTSKPSSTQRCQARFDVRGGSNNTLISSCTVVCPSPDPSTTYIGAGDGSCSGVGCCQANIVLRYSRYTVQIHDLQEQDAPSSSPTFNDGSAYIVDQPFNYTGLMIFEKNFPQALPAMLDWFIVGDNSTCPMSTNESAPAPASAAECRSVHSFYEGYYGDVSDDVVLDLRGDYRRHRRTAATVAGTPGHRRLPSHCALPTARSGGGKDTAPIRRLPSHRKGGRHRLPPHATIKPSRGPMARERRRGAERLHRPSHGKRAADAKD